MVLQSVAPEASSRDFDPALFAALERIEDAAAHIAAAQACVWVLAKKDATSGDIAIQLTGLLGSIKARRHALEEEAGV